MSSTAVILNETVQLHTSNSTLDLTIPNDCVEAYKEETEILRALNDTFCQTLEDEFGLCWPPATADQWVTQDCPVDYFSHYFDAIGTCQRFCHENGTWEPTVDFSNCTIKNPTLTTLPQFNVYLYTYILSIIALLFGIIILQYFIPLRCVRNSIHSHFMLSILIRGVVWLGSAVVVVYFPDLDILGNILVIFRVFILVAVYSWMLVEGIYLFSLLFWTLTVQNFGFYGFFAIGWGTPGVLSLGYAITKLSKKISSKWEDASLMEPEGAVVLGSILCMLAVNLIITAVTIYTLLTKVQRRSMTYRHPGRSLSSRCRTVGEVLVNYVHQGSPSRTEINKPRVGDTSSLNKPVPNDEYHVDDRSNRVSSAELSSDVRPVSSVLVNGSNRPKQDVLLVLKKRVLLNAKRSSRSPSLRKNSLEPWKALKAILVLMPILGYPQLIFLRPYFADFEWIFEYVNALIIGTQGFWVSVIYCFCNSEVQRLIKLRWRQWRYNSSNV